MAPASVAESDLSTVIHERKLDFFLVVMFCLERGLMLMFQCFSNQYMFYIERSGLIC